MRSRIRPVQAADSFAQSARSVNAIVRQLVELDPDLLERQADLLREDDEPDPPDHGARIATVPGVGAFGPNQAFLFVKPQRRRRDAAPRGHLADGQDGVHAASVAEFPLDFKCT